MARILYLVLLLLFCFHSNAQEIVNAVPGEVIVKFKASHNQFTTLGKVASSAQIINRKSWPSLNLHHFSTKPGDSVSDVIGRLQADPSVEFAEPNYYLYASINSTSSSNPSFTQSSANIRVTQAWSRLSAAKSIDQLPIVAVIDSGLDLTHSVFKDTDRVYINSGEIPANRIDDDGNGFIDDVSGWNFINDTASVTDSTGHGTHVSGIVLGVTEDVVRFDSQRSPRIQILPLKFLNSEGVGKTTDAIEAIAYAIQAGAKVINNSWGGPSYSSTLHSVFSQAYLNGITIISAAGNEASNNDVKPVYPSSLDIPSMISVAASTEQDNYASFSNYGLNTVNVFAPGVGIYSTIPSNGYGLSTGTSMSAPFVSGLAALVVSEAPSLSGFQVKEIILNTGDLRSWFSTYVESGRRVNFENAIIQAKSQSSTANYQPDYNPVYSQGSRSLASTDNLGALGCARVSEFYDQTNKNFYDLDRSSAPPTNSNFGFIFLLLPIGFIVYYRFQFRNESKRKYDRKKVDFKGHLITSSGFIFPVHVMDLSLAGAGIQIKDFDPNIKIEKATLVILNFLLPKQKRQRFKGEVKRTTQSGFIGLEFETRRKL